MVQSTEAKPGLSCTLLPGSFELHYIRVNFRMDFFFLISAKKIHWEFDRDCVEFVDHFGY